MNANKRVLRSDLKKVDASRPAGTDYDDVPELDDDFFEQADEHIGGVLVKRGRGRPRSSEKKPVSIRLDSDLIEAYKADGEGWQTRMNDALRDYARSHGML
ncbi:BrnA antitoxin family protein [Paraburkholderia acidipaludis]|uniref:BrnA antitoxin family protein n=1 Tax=Paraburkholderia acidipaludis TaxID=660537 RepID=UPI000A070704|nr:BrnA antitoxin family protein [Paraburkholderia acidipaludis]